MDCENIFKIKLRIIKKDILEIIPKLFPINNYTYKKDRIINETKEEYVKNIISKFFELRITNEKYWEQLDLLVYWDTKDYFAYEIITGIKIPLFLISEYNDEIQNIGLTHNNYRYKTLFLYNYSLISNYGYFGQINCYNVNKLDLQYSIESLNYLRAYIEIHRDYNLYEKILNNKIKECNETIDKIIKQMVIMIDKNDDNLDYDSFITKNISNEAEQLLKKLKYQTIKER